MNKTYTATYYTKLTNWNKTRCKTKNNMESMKIANMPMSTTQTSIQSSKKSEINY